MNTKAIFPGTFDPVTNGHLDIIKRAAVLFPTVVVAVAASTSKAPRFSLVERTRFIEASVEGLPNVVVRPFEGLLVDFAAKEQASVIIRSLRSVVDYEYEMQLSRMNHHLQPAIETVFLIPSATSAFLSSSLIREVSLMGGDISALIPPAVVDAIKQKSNEEYKNI